MKKRLLSALLAAAMVLTMAPAAFAVNKTTMENDINETEFYTGVQKEFTITTTIGTDVEGKTVLGVSEFNGQDAIASMEYLDGQEWKNLLHDGDGMFGPAEGIQIPKDYSSSIQPIQNKFRVTFKEAGVYTFTASLVGKNDETVYASTSATFTVNLNPVTKAKNWKNTFESALGSDAGKSNMTWSTIVTAIYYYTQAEDYVGKLTEGEYKTDVSNRLNAIKDYYAGVEALDMSGKSIVEAAEDFPDINTGCLAMFTGLKTLNLSNTGVSDGTNGTKDKLGGLEDMTSLETLDLSGNIGITQASFGALKSGLESLNLAGTGVTAIGGLVKNGDSDTSLKSTLTTLDISDTAIDELNELWDATGGGSAAFTVLTTLYANNLALTSINGLFQWVQSLKDLSRITCDLEGSTLTETPENITAIIAITKAFENTEKFTPAYLGTMDRLDVVVDDASITNPEVGQTLTAKIWVTNTGKEQKTISDDDPRISYKWYHSDEPDTALSTTATYKVSEDDSNKTICVAVNVIGYSGSPKIWQASAPVGSYLITATAGEGGSISPSDEVTVLSGKSQNFTIQADPGYSIADVKVDGESQGAISSYTFENVTKNHTIDATFTKGATSTSSGGSGSSSSSGYSVTVPSVSNGTVSVSPKNAAKGKTVTVTVKPNTGYELSTLTVTDNAGDAVTLTKVSDTEYTFTMPASRVTVRATFAQVAQQPTEPEMAFTDVAAGAYYYDAVKWAVEEGITSGTTATTFSPNASCTRAQMVSFLWRANGSPKATGANPFTDVAADTYYYDAVLWAVEQGITSGTSATTFSPNATVTRAQTVSFLHREAGSPATTGANPFADVAADTYYAAAVQWAVANNITAGTTASTFSPDSACTRGQIVSFLYRAQ